MANEDNDTFIFFGDGDRETARTETKKEKVQTGIIPDARMEIEELSELNDDVLGKETRSDIFMGRKLDSKQKDELHKTGNVRVRGHTKIINNKVVVVEPYIRKK